MARRRLRFVFNLILLVAPAGLICLFAALLMRRVLNYLNSGPRLAGILSVEATRALGREVRVGSIVFKHDPWNLLPNRVELGDIHVAQGPEGSSPPLVEADKVVVWYDLRQILFEKDLRVPLVNEVRIERPRAYLARNASGRWNFAQLIKPSTAIGRPFTSRFVFRDGALDYRDLDLPRVPGISRQPFATRLDRLTGVVLLRPDRSTAFDLGGNGMTDLVHAFHITGIITGIGQVRPARIDAHVVANGLSFPNLARRVLRPALGSIARGQGDIDLAVLYAPSTGAYGKPLELSALDAHGNLTVRSLTASLPSLAEPITDLNGALTLTLNSVLGTLNGRFAGTNFDLQGRLLDIKRTLADVKRAARRGVNSLRPPGPGVEVQGTLRNADYGRITRAINFKRVVSGLQLRTRSNILNAQAHGDIDFRFVGPLDAPTAALRARLALAHYDRYRADQIDLRAFYANRAIDADARGRFARGQAAVRGHVMADPHGDFEIEAHGRDLQMAALEEVTHQKLGGVGQLDFAIQGQRHVTPSITMQALIHDLSYRRENLQSVYAYATTIGDPLIRWGEPKPERDRLKRLRLQTFRVEDPKGFALGSGTLDLKTQRLDVDVASDNLDIGAFARAATQGTTKAGPPLVAPVTGKEAQPGVSNLSNGNLSNIDLSKAQGAGYVRAHVGGTLRNPEVSGRASALALEAGKLSLDSINADFNINRQAIVLNSLIVRRYTDALNLTGTVSDLRSRDPKLALTASLSRVDLGDLIDLLTSPAAPEADQNRLLVTGRLYTGPIDIGGTLHHPRLENPVEVSVEGVDGASGGASLNELALPRITATATYNGSLVHLDQAQVDVAGGSLTATGDIGRDFMDVAVSGKGIDVQKLTAVVPVPTETDDIRPVPTFDIHGMHGTLGFTARVLGPPTNPHASGHITAADLGYRDFVLGTLQGSARYADGRVTAQDVSLRQPGIPAGQPDNVRVPNLAYNVRQGTVAGQVRWTDVSLKRLESLIKSNVLTDADGNNLISKDAAALNLTLNGLVSGTLDLTGTRDRPVADVTWNARNVSIMDQQISTISGSALAEPDRVQVPSPRHPRSWLRLNISNLNSPDAIIEAKNVDVRRNGDDGAVAGDVSVLGFNLGQLHSLIPPSTDSANRYRDALRQIAGTADSVYLTFQGSLKRPEIVISANLSNLSYAGQTLDRIDLSHAIIREPQIQFDDIDFTKRRISGDANSETFRAHLANGRIDFGWESPFIRKDAAFALDVDIPSTELNALAAFSKPAAVGKDEGLFASDTQGAFEAHAHVDGTLDTLSDGAQDTLDKLQPVGTLKLNAPILHFNIARTGLRNLAAEVSFKNGNVTVGSTADIYDFGKGVANAKRPGGSLSISGSLPLKTPDMKTPDTPEVGAGIVIAAPAFKIDEKPLPGTASPGESGSGSLHGEGSVNIAIRRSLFHPVLAGAVTLENTTLTPPNSFGAATGPGLKFPINPAFDLTLDLRRNVRISNSLLNARLDGSVTIKGDLFKKSASLADLLRGNFVPDALAVPPGRGQETGAGNPATSNLAINLLGQLTLRDGRLSLPTARFTILPPGTSAPGTLTLRYPDYDPSQPGQPILGVNVDLAAQTYLTLPTSNTISGRRSYRVTVVARGPVTGLATDPITGRPRLSLNFQTDPPDFSGNQQGLEQSIASSLGGSTVEGIGRNPGEAITQQLTNVLTNRFTSGFFDRPANALGFEQFSVNYDPVQVLNLLVSRRVVGPIYVTYDRSLGGPYEMYNLKVSFRFSSRYQLSYDTDEQDTQRVLLEGVLRF